MRKLASIQKVLKVEDIPGADKIEKVTILGWEVVCKKGDFKVDDLVIYVEIDSILPDKPEFEFMRERKFRVRTIRLRGQVSQGICFPLSLLRDWKYSPQEGDDVTEMLGVTKYETASERQDRIKQEVKLSRIQKVLMRYSWFRKFIYKPTKTGFPSFISKTDESRIQLFPTICEDYKNVEFFVTEKLDGQSVTFFIIKNDKKWYQVWKEKYVFGVCSRNFHLLKEDNSNWWRVAREFNIKNKLIRYIKTTDFKYFVIQGEIIGKGIQGNKYALHGLDFYIFNIFSDCFIYDNDEIDYLSIQLGLQMVPYLENEFLLKPTIKENIEYAKGISTLYNTLREGVVVRNYQKGISFKIINPDFLLQEE